MTNSLEKLRNLQSQMTYHNKLYYQDNTPEITDAEYDLLRRELEILEKTLLLQGYDPNLPEFKNSPTQKIGEHPQENFKKVSHKTQMGSLENALTPEEAIEFYQKIKKDLGLQKEDPLEIIQETKVDGLSCSLHYHFGKLILAATRGDGFTGDDVTHTVKTIKNIPHTLKEPYPEFIEIRGEVHMTKEVFNSLNATLEKPFVTSRNAAAGSLKMLDSQEAAKRNLSFLAYALGEIPALYKTQTDIRKALKNWGFDLNEPSTVVSTEEDFLTLYNTLLETRDDLPYDIDGIVYKVNSIPSQNALGTISKYPKWAIAHKFPAEKTITQLESIQIQIGRTGVLTPVALLKPVQLGGVTISKATLHNKDDMTKKEIYLKDWVVLERSGDVIPKITGSLPERRTGEQTPYEFPKTCPSCGTDIIQKPGYTGHYCPNTSSCPAQQKEKITHAVSKSALNIDGLGEKVIQELFEDGYIQKTSDIFTLKERNGKDFPLLSERSGWGKKSENALFKSIETAKLQSFDTILYSLSIPQIGRSLTKILKSHYPTWESFIDMILSETAKEKLKSIEGIGDTIAEDCIAYFRNENNRKEIELLLSHITLKESKELSGPLVGKTVVFTGTFTQKRSDLEKYVETLGGKCSNSVSKKTNYVVVGNDAGSKKEKAEKLKLPLYNEEEWISFLKEITSQQ